MVRFFQFILCGNIQESWFEKLNNYANSGVRLIFIYIQWNKLNNIFDFYKLIDINYKF